ncbi:hypothetical protein Ahy_A01g001545 [Arachis hypogaea]|uniref:HP domain-containing protein n=1 Tax=Arachis hypogaea TaxID=3818 RepID=A0A445ENM8_ARAHY|nr:hypothetical protein Ahy_A01g001545 [Arachis hypogaea]
MAVSMKDLDPAFKGAGQKEYPELVNNNISIFSLSQYSGLEIWRIENFNPVPIPESSHGKFYTGDSYVILKTTASKSGALRHDIHFWLGKDTSQDEAGTAAIKTVELDATLGGRAVQYREVQGHETEKFLSYFKPCIIPQEGGIASGFNHAEAEEYKTRLFEVKGKHVVHVREVPFARSSLNHDDVFILDTESKIFQFNGSTSSIQERAKALEVVQYIKDTYHDGKCDIAAIEDGKLMADAESGEFWALFGGFAPLPRKGASDDAKHGSHPLKLLRVEKGKAEPIEADSLTRELLETKKCYILDCGLEVFIWMGRNTSLDARKSAGVSAEELLNSTDRPKSQIIRIIEGFETVMFKSKFDSWPETTNVQNSEDGRGKVAALLKRQGVDVKGLLKAEPVKEEPKPHIDCTGHLQVWRVNGQEKISLPDSELSKFYSGDCYIFQYTYNGDDREECLIGAWMGNNSVEGDRTTALSMGCKMVESMKFIPSMARIYEGSEPIQFHAIMQTFIVFKGGLSDGYKNHIAEKGIPDETYKEAGVALFRIQGSDPENMQAIQVEPVASSLNSSHCYILHSETALFSWSGSLTTSEDHELVERMLDFIKPELQPKSHKEGIESEQFWELLGGKTEYPSQKIVRGKEHDPHLFSCHFSKGGDLKVKEIYNFSQDDLMTEDIFILDCHSEIFVWVGQGVDPKSRMQSLTIGEKFIEHDFLLEKLSRTTPMFIVMEGSEPPFFTCFFKWEAAKAAMLGNSFQRKLTILRNGGTPPVVKPKRRPSLQYGDKCQRSSRSMSVSPTPERVRVRGRSPAFNAIASTFEKPKDRNLSTPPPIVRKVYPKSGTANLNTLSLGLGSKSSAIARLTSSFEMPSARGKLIPQSLRVTSNTLKSNPERSDSEDSMSSRLESLTEEDAKEGEADDDEGLPVYPYDSVNTASTNPVPDIDVTKREAYLSATEFKEKLGMTKTEFYKLPKWKQNKLKVTVQLF